MQCVKCDFIPESAVKYCPECGTPFGLTEFAAHPAKPQPPTNMNAAKSRYRARNYALVAGVTITTFFVLAFVLFPDAEEDNSSITQVSTSQTEFPHAMAQPLTPKEVADNIKPSTVSISFYFKESDALFDDEFSSSGSGVIVNIDSDGDYWIATNSHVWGFHTMLEADSDGQPEISEYQIVVTFWDQKQSVPLAILDHPTEDCAFVVISGDVGAYPIAQLTNTIPSVGDTVYAMGHPLGLEYTFTKGMVSAIRDNSQDAARPFRHIQIDTAISPGNSGGPLIGEDGKILGLNTYGMSEGQNLNFALSSTDMFRDYTDEMFYLIPLDPAGLTQLFIH